jgi:hypothetical protein
MPDALNIDTDSHEALNTIGMKQMRKRVKIVLRT